MKNNFFVPARTHFGRGGPLWQKWIKNMNDIKRLLEQRILIIDGAMGTMIQQHKLAETDYRGERFKDWASDLKGNNDLLTLTQPEIIKEIHKQYLVAGADIIETNTFNAQRVSLADYHMEELAYEINLAAAKIAREAIDEFAPPLSTGGKGQGVRQLPTIPNPLVLPLFDKWEYKKLRQAPFRSA